MGWAKFDDAYYSHRKLVAAGLEARGLDAAGITYCAHQLTDGFVSDDILPMLAVGSNHVKVVAKLVAVGRWSRDDENAGYWIHDYLDYNPDAAKVEKDREAERERKKRGRNHQGRGADGRVVSGRRPAGHPPDVPPESERSPTGNPGSVPPVRTTTGPVPSRPDPSSSSSESDLQPVSAHSSEEDDETLRNLWKSWAHLKLRQRRDTGRDDPDYVTAWLRTVADDLAETHSDAALALLAELPSATSDELLERLTAPPPKLAVVPDGHQRHRTDWGATSDEVWDELDDGTVRRRDETA